MKSGEAVKDALTGDIISGVISKIWHHRGEVVQMFPPNVPPHADDPPIMFRDLFSPRRYDGRNVGNFWHGHGWSLDLGARVGVEVGGKGRNVRST